MIRRILLSTLVVVVLGVAATAAAGGPAAAPKPKTGAVPWQAPGDPIRRVRLAGLVPERFEHLEYHVHSHLDIFVNGRRVKIPAAIGINIHDPGVHSGKMPDGSLAYGSAKCVLACISPLHTHADYGLVHTESSSPTPNRLGQFFVEWGVRLDRRCVGGYCKPDSIRIYVNGKLFGGDPRSILLGDHTEIAIAIGTLPKRIPSRYPSVPL